MAVRVQRFCFLSFLTRSALLSIIFSSRSVCSRESQFEPAVCLSSVSASYCSGKVFSRDNTALVGSTSLEIYTNDSPLDRSILISLLLFMYCFLLVFSRYEPASIEGSWNPRLRLYLFFFLFFSLFTVMGTDRVCKGSSLTSFLFAIL